MNSAMEAARQVAREYFSAKGKQTPEEQATEFLTRIRILPDGSWPSDRMVDTACRIVSEANFDVDDFVENHLRLPLAIEPLNEFDKSAGSPVFGVTFFRPPEIVICERAEQYMPLYRTCVAHEVGHVILHSRVSHRDSMNYSPGSANRPPEEREADLFMTSLLAPRPVMILAVLLAAVESSIHGGEVWNNANSSRGRYQWKEFIFPILIDRLCLSRLLLSIQMQRFGIFNSETAAFHKSYRLPNRWRR